MKILDQAWLYIAVCQIMSHRLYCAYQSVWSRNGDSVLVLNTYDSDLYLLKKQYANWTPITN